MILGLRTVLPIGLVAHISWFFYEKLVYGEFNFDDVWWSRRLAIFRSDSQGWDYLYTVINAVWLFGLALGTMAAFLINKPADKIVYVSDSNSSIPPGISG